MSKTQTVLIMGGACVGITALILMLDSNRAKAQGTGGMLTGYAPAGNPVGGSSSGSTGAVEDQSWRAPANPGGWKYRFKDSLTHIVDDAHTQLAIDNWITRNNNGVDKATPGRHEWFNGTDDNIGTVGRGPWSETMFQNRYRELTVEYNLSLPPINMKVMADGGGATGSGSGIGGVIGSVAGGIAGAAIPGGAGAGSSIGGGIGKFLGGLFGG